VAFLECIAVCCNRTYKSKQSGIIYIGGITMGGAMMMMMMMMIMIIIKVK